jgi:hypothetical protein
MSTDCRQGFGKGSVLKTVQARIVSGCHQPLTFVQGESLEPREPRQPEPYREDDSIDVFAGIIRVIGHDSGRLLDIPHSLDPVNVVAPLEQNADENAEPSRELADR